MKAFQDRERYSLRLPDIHMQGYSNAVKAEGDERIGGASGWVDTYLVLTDDGAICVEVPAWMVMAELEARAAQKTKEPGANPALKIPSHQP